MNGSSANPVGGLTDKEVSLYRFGNVRRGFARHLPPQRPPALHPAAPDRSPSLSGPDRPAPSETRSTWTGGRSVGALRSGHDRCPRQVPAGVEWL
jgi:hypothetical protein